MSTRLDLGRILFLILLFTLSCMTLMAGNIKGNICDKETREPLTGATVQVAGTSLGAVADIDGNYQLNLRPGNYTLQVSYVGYRTETRDVAVTQANLVLNFELGPDTEVLGEVTVTARKNLEGERALQMERQKATLAIENMGAKEMSLKGISNVQEGVKQITGISIADAGQLIVRGLGDRYSTTTLNGLPIASPNPDNKLIPLDLFPSSTVQNITVSKVYDAAVFADYSGAHIDISTKENTTGNFFNLSLNAGGHFNALGKDFYHMDRGSLFTTSTLADPVYDLSTSDFRDYVKQNNIFDTTFDVERKKALPELSGNIGAGRDWTIGNQTLSLLASFSMSNGTEIIQDAFYRDMDTSGDTKNDFSYDKYTSRLNLTGLASASITLRKEDRIGYSFFYARNAENSYQDRQGTDYEDNHLLGNNSVTHIYTLQNHQLNGLHHFGQQWLLTWGGSYGKTSSQEPNRRQVMFEQNNDGTLELFKLNQQETNRYFGDLTEDEWVGSLALKYNWNENNHVTAGFNYKDKNRDYSATRFYYNLHALNPEIDDIHHTSDYLNQENIANGTIIVNRNMQPQDRYRAGMNIYAGYIQTDFYPLASLLVNVGLRYEYAQQWVEYAIEGERPYQRRRDLDKHDLFPTVNLKYSINNQNNLRLSISRTITRPSFIEMAPFLYEESYGSARIRGNENLQNGYNYNLDLRYERFGDNGDMLSITGYFKHLDKPIERTQIYQGGGTTHSFQNADQGMATGIEAEVRKQLFKDLRLGANISYMYTNVKRPESGAYTNKERSLQGASPILLNADLTYSPRFSEERALNLTLLYNLQGKRIHAVGLSGMGDVEQQAVHTLNFNASYALNSHFTLKLQVNDLLNRDVVYKQELPQAGQTVEVERYKTGSNFEVGFSYRL